MFLLPEEMICLLVDSEAQVADNHEMAEDSHTYSMSLQSKRLMPSELTNKDKENPALLGSCFLHFSPVQT